METVIDNTSVDTDTVSEEVDTGAEKYENFSLDDLNNITADDYEEFEEDAQHKGMKPLSYWLKHVHPDVRMHIANFRADYTKKTQSLSEMRKDLEAQKAALKSNNDSFVNGSLARQVAEIDTETQYDLFDEQGMKAEIKRQAALMLKDMLQPAQEEIKLQQRKMDLERFKSDNPELTSPEYRQPIVEMLRAKPHLSLEEAFYIVKAKVGATKVDQDRAELAERKSRQRETIKMSSSGSRATPSGTPQFKNSWDAYNYHKNKISK